MILTICDVVTALYKFLTLFATQPHEHVGERNNPCYGKPRTLIIPEFPLPLSYIF